LIRSREGQGSTGLRLVEEEALLLNPFALPRHGLTARVPGRKSYILPAPRPGKAMGHLVSVLDLEQNRLGNSQPLSGPAPSHAHTRANQRF
jgi:hypothetical protein